MSNITRSPRFMNINVAKKAVRFVVPAYPHGKAGVDVTTFN